MSAQHFMRSPPISVRRGTPTIEAARIMARENIGLVVIVDDTSPSKPVGVISERDIVRALARGVDLNRPVEEVGTTNRLVVVSADTPLTDVIITMRENRVRHVLVVDNEGDVVGVISIRDLLNERCAFYDVESSVVEEVSAD